MLESQEAQFFELPDHHPQSGFERLDHLCEHFGSTSYWLAEALQRMRMPFQCSLKFLDSEPKIDFLNRGFSKMSRALAKMLETLLIYDDKQNCAHDSGITENDKGATCSNYPAYPCLHPKPKLLREKFVGIGLCSGNISCSYALSYNFDLQTQLHGPMLGRHNPKPFLPIFFRFQLQILFLDHLWRVAAFKSHPFDIMGDRHTIANVGVPEFVGANFNRYRPELIRQDWVPFFEQASASNTSPPPP